MSRPIEFDRPKAVNRALVLFWRKGYQATSLTDLLETMDIGRSSFYAAFKDKRTSNIECLDLFADRTFHLLQIARYARGGRSLAPTSSRTGRHVDTVQ